MKTFISKAIFILKTSFWTALARLWEMKERFVIESIKLTNWAVKCRACDERLNQEFEEK